MQYERATQRGPESELIENEKKRLGAAATAFLFYVFQLFSFSGSPAAGGTVSGNSFWEQFLGTLSFWGSPGAALIWLSYKP